MKKGFEFNAFLTLMVCLSVVPFAWSASEMDLTEVSMDFNQRLKVASSSMYSSRSAATKEFEALLKANPEEWLIYSTYGDALTRGQKFAAAIDVYERALARDSKRMVIRGDEIRDRIRTLEKKQTFSEMMKFPQEIDT